MTWWRKRQLTLIFLLLLSLALIAFSGWIFIKPDPNCFDGRKNQNELGVDCGGECAQVCSFEAKPLLPLWTRIFKINNQTYSVIAYIENLNANLGIASTDYTITVTGQSGEVLATREGSIFVNNRERFAVFAGNFVLPESQTPARAFISFKNPTWQYVKNITPDITVKHTAFSNTPIPRLEAEVVNNSVYDLVNVPVTVVLSNSAGEALSGSFTIVEKLAKGSKQNIFFTWPTSFSEVPVLFDFYPHINGFEIK